MSFKDGILPSRAPVDANRGGAVDELSARPRASARLITFVLVFWQLILKEHQTESQLVLDPYSNKSSSALLKNKLC